jgi:hypothetical protein
MRINRAGWLNLVLVVLALAIGLAVITIWLTWPQSI